MTETIEKPVVTTKRRDVLLLAVFPALYMANSFAPWSRRLFGGDHSAWLPFWGSAAVLHWLTVALVGIAMRRRGWNLRDVAIDLRRSTYAWAPFAVAGIGVCAVVVRETLGRLDVLGLPQAVQLSFHSGAPRTMSERLLWVFMGMITAGFCEEFVYRGFGFHALKANGWAVRTAIVVASLSWIGLHGLAGVFAFPWYALIAVSLGGLLLRTKSLVPSIALHSTYHLFVILGS